MSDTVLLALIAQVGTFLGVVVVAYFGRKKLNEVHELVNGNSTKQVKLIERQSEQIADLANSLSRKGG